MAIWESRKVRFWPWAADWFSLVGDGGFDILRVHKRASGD